MGCNKSSLNVETGALQRGASGSMVNGDDGRQSVRITGAFPYGMKIYRTSQNDLLQPVAPNIMSARGGSMPHVGAGIAF